MDLDSVADELYRASPDEFVELRTRRVVEARAAKDRALVKAVTALRRPTRSAWLVNLLAHDAPEDVAGLLELGAALADAQRRGSGPDLRRLSAQRHATLETLARRAVALGAQQGHVATEASRQEVTQTLQAALSDPGVADLVRAGRVIQPASYGGFGPLDLLAAMTPPAAAAPESAETPPASESSREEPAGPEQGEAPSAEQSDATAEAGAESAALQEAEAVVQAARESLETARTQARVAAEAAAAETARADELAERVDALRAKLEEAEAAGRQAQDTARVARRQQAQAREEVAAAESALSAAEDAVSAAEDALAAVAPS